ncbi:MAG: NAD(+) synthase, partial [Candidatus Velamenicoccus archaeovorus]
MVRIALGQVNCTVGDLQGNVERMAAWAARATEAGADLACFPELAVTGYPPEDLVLRPEFVRDNLEALDELARRTAGGCAVLTGFVDRSEPSERLEICRARARETGAWIVYVNMVGGQDELVFDGGSMVVSPDGELVWHAAVFEEDLLVVDLDVPSAARGFPGPDVPAIGKPPLPDPNRPAWPEGPEEVYRALVLGLGDYVRKNGFREVVLGLSGGIDSALTAVLAADALGSGAVRALAMPSPYSSTESVDDARDVAGRLGIRLDEIGIDGVFAAYRSALEDVFRGTRPDVAEENVQARIRGNLVMAISNKFGSLALATGNKSEYAVGYSTLYGDMAGGFAPIKDVPKTLVYELAAWRNAQP